MLTELNSWYILNIISDCHVICRWWLYLNWWLHFWFGNKQYPVWTWSRNQVTHTRLNSFTLSLEISIDNQICCWYMYMFSIGSLGRGGNYVQVEDISISDAIFTRTTNGARIKTWQVTINDHILPSILICTNWLKLSKSTNVVLQKVGRGYVKNVTFERLRFNNVQNPIIIDQNYCDFKNGCPELVIRNSFWVVNICFQILTASMISLSENWSSNKQCNLP